MKNKAKTPSRPLRPPQEMFELDIDTMAHGGRGIGRYKGSGVLVPYTIPGERVQARMVRADDRAKIAEGVRLIEASADRVYPRCPHFGPGRCWRCQWQHIDYTAQLLLKQDMLIDQLERLGDISNDVVRPLIASPEQWQYNYHMTFMPLAEGGLGLPAADERIVPIETCHVLHPDLLAFYETLDLDLTGLRRLKLQIGSDGALMIILYMSDENAPELEADFAASVNLLLPDNEPMNLVGESHSRYQIKDRQFRVTAGSYLRANVAQIPQLVDQVLALLNLAPHEYVLDIYAGVGVFSASLAPRCQLVTMVESYPPAVTDAEANLADLENVDIIEGSAEEVLAALDGEYDAAVVDPSFGLSDDALTGLADLGVGRIVYVSGDMNALAKDCKRLAKAGYRLEVIQPLDFAPQTYHVDSAALFLRG
jgi:23S rRNA (uracil1939-C5)-methyltransferase